MPKIHWLFIVLGLAAVNGCSKDSEAAEAQPAAASQGDDVTPSPSGMTGPKMGALTEAQIVQVLATVDTGEIEQARLALTKATNPAVREFAQHMIEEHTRSREEGAQLANQARITPAVSETANELQSGGARTLEKLQEAEAPNFDQRYMAAQLKQHQDVLRTLDEELIPSATDSALRDQLTKTRAMVQAHIARAKQLQM